MRYICSPLAYLLTYLLSAPATTNMTQIPCGLLQRHRRSELVWQQSLFSL